MMPVRPDPRPARAGAFDTGALPARGLLKGSRPHMPSAGAGEVTGRLPEGWKGSVSSARACAQAAAAKVRVITTIIYPIFFIRSYVTQAGKSENPEVKAFLASFARLD